MSLTGWRYYSEITISNPNSSVLTDYQVGIDLDSSNFDFSKANSDGSDIRFSEDNGNTTIPYYIESWDNSGQTATVWVKVSSVPASSSKTIYMYYGNPVATSASNLGNVATKKEDFEDGTVGVFSNVWKTNYFSVTTEKKYEGSYSLKCNDSNNADNGGAYANENTFWDTAKKRIVFWMYDYNCSDTLDIYLNYGSTLKAFVGFNADTGKFHYWDGSGHDLTESYLKDTWYKFEVLLKDNDYDFKIYDSSLSLVTSKTGISYGAISGVDYRDVVFYSSKANTGIGYLDLVYAFKYISPEPTTSVGVTRANTNSLFFTNNF
jgi:hypothetical protein